MGRNPETTAGEPLGPKEVARRQVRRINGARSASWAAEASRVITASVAQLVQFRSARAMGCYLALPHEVQTSELLHHAWTTGKRVAVPAERYGPDQYDLAWYRPGDALRTGGYKIQEPVSPEWVIPGELDVLIVPCVAFDDFGRRLGHGGGHYDRLMSLHTCTRICLAFDEQRLDAVPVGPRDVIVDFIATESGVLKAKAPA